MTLWLNYFYICSQGETIFLFEREYRFVFTVFIYISVLPKTLIASSF